MSKRYRPTNTDELVECMTREDEELEVDKQSQRRQWAAHLDAVTAAVTTAGVRNSYRNHLVRLVLFLYNNTTCNSDDSSIEGTSSLSHHH
jgi:hypothetical protein